MKTAIELRAARLGSDAPREEFVTDLHRRLAGEMAEEQTPVAHPRWAPRRRQVVIGGSVAAASAAAGLVVGRNLLAPDVTQQATPPTQGELEPNAGTWRTVGASGDLPEGGALAFDLGSVNGFVHRADAKLEAVSGVCTHQGCKLWLDAPESRLRCPCHSTSFSLEGTTVTHQLPIAPPPLPKFQVREINGVIEVFAPTRAGVGAYGVGMTDTPWEPPLAGTELEHLVGVLDRLRMTFRWKADDLDAAGLRTRIGASALTLGGLAQAPGASPRTSSSPVKLTGEPVGEPWESLWDGTDDWEFTSAAEDTPEQLYAFWEAAVERSRAGSARRWRKAAWISSSTSPRPRASMRACADCCAT